MGHCWLNYLDGSFEEWKYDKSVRIAACGFAQCGYDLLISALSRNVLASSLA